MLLDSDKNRIQHMIDAARETIEYSQGCDLEALQENRPLQHLLVRNITILGEAAARVSERVQKTHSEIPWRDMIDTRNRLIHAYFKINLLIVLKTVKQDLPQLLPLLEALRDQM